MLHGPAGQPRACVSGAPDARDADTNRRAFWLSVSHEPSNLAHGHPLLLPRFKHTLCDQTTNHKQNAITVKASFVRAVSVTSCTSRRWALFPFLFSVPSPRSWPCHDPYFGEPFALCNCRKSAGTQLQEASRHKVGARCLEPTLALRRCPSLCASTSLSRSRRAALCAAFGGRGLRACLHEHTGAGSRAEQGRSTSFGADPGSASLPLPLCLPPPFPVHAGQPCAPYSEAAGRACLREHAGAGSRAEQGRSTPFGADPGSAELPFPLCLHPPVPLTHAAVCAAPRGCGHFCAGTYVQEAWRCKVGARGSEPTLALRPCPSPWASTSPPCRRTAACVRRSEALGCPWVCTAAQVQEVGRRKARADLTLSAQL